MKNIWIGVMIIVFLLTIPLPMVSADIIFPGQKSTSFSYEISNINDYDEYVFVLYGGIGAGPMTTGPSVINSGESISFYKYNRPSIYAITQTIFNQSILSNKSSREQYFNNNTEVIKSNIALYRLVGTVDENDPLESTHIVIRIATLNTTALILEKTKVIYTYTDGSSEEKTFTSQDVLPPRSKTALIPYWVISLWYIWIPLIALILIILILILRKRRVKKQ